ncbi:MAG: hypothetical protein IKO62_03925 [Bacteroidales bacterium]|nr:hypothetical protein [Bacteroidales bacterium]
MSFTSLTNQTESGIANNVSQHYIIDNEYAWYLPWMAEYNGIPFRCYNIALSHWVSDCFPKKYDGKNSTFTTNLS